MDLTPEQELTIQAFTEAQVLAARHAIEIRKKHHLSWEVIVPVVWDILVAFSGVKELKYVNSERAYAAIIAAIEACDPS